MLTKFKFDIYDAENPQVYRMFEQFTLQVIKTGRKNFGAQVIAERLRWYSAIETISDDYKINNDYVAFYARKFEELHPEHKGFFRKRRSVADEVSALF